MQQLPPCNNKRLFLSQELSDFSLTVRDRDRSLWRFPVHTAVLSSQSVVFKSMFENEFSETRNSYISDIKPRAMELLLCYFYKVLTNISSWWDCRELLRAAHKYQVEPLVQHCARILKTVLTLSNVCYIYNDATLYSLEALRQRCLHLIHDGGFSVLRNKSFEVLTKEALMDVMSSRWLNMETELMKFEALLRWARMQCCRLGLPVTEANILQELKPFLKGMRLDYLSDTEKSALPPAVLSLVQPSNLLIMYEIGSYLGLVGHCSRFTFTEDPNTAIPLSAPSLTLVAFSLSAPAHLIDLRSPLPLIRSGCILLLNTSKFKKAEKIREGMMMYRTRWLEANTVYQVEMVAGSQKFRCVPGTRLETETVLTERGPISISIHCQNVYGIIEIVFL